MSDLIDRQAAINAVNRAVTKEAARWSIQELPSAQPEHHAENLLAYAHDMGVTLEQAEKELRVVQPERKTGRWIDGQTNGEKFMRCSLCGNIEWEKPTNYCPSCGAKMEVEHE